LVSPEADTDRRIPMQITCKNMFPGETGKGSRETRARGKKPRGERAGRIQGSLHSQGLRDWMDGELWEASSRRWRGRLAQV